MYRFLIIIISVFVFSCVKNDNSESQEWKIDTIWIDVADSLTNFESLLATNYLYYLNHMSINYDNHGKDFWEEIDTVNLDDQQIKRFRRGACQKSVVSDSLNFCIEQQEHTIDKAINKVVKFKGIGSGYFTTVEFKYNHLGRLIEYQDLNKTFLFNYSKNGVLQDVLLTEIKDEISTKTKRIKFSKKNSE